MSWDLGIAPSWMTLLAPKSTGVLKICITIGRTGGRIIDGFVFLESVSSALIFRHWEVIGF